MKSMYLAFLAAILIAVVADLGLDHIGFSAAERTSSAGNVRLD